MWVWPMRRHECEIDFMTAMSLWDGDEEKGRGFNLREFIGRNLILPKEDPVISAMLAYKEGQIWFCGQKTRFDLGEASCSFSGWVNRFVNLDTPLTGYPDKCYEERNGWEIGKESANAYDKVGEVSGQRISEELLDVGQWPRELKRISSTKVLGSWRIEVRRLAVWIRRW